MVCSLASQVSSQPRPDCWERNPPQSRSCTSRLQLEFRYRGRRWKRWRFDSFPLLLSYQSYFVGIYSRNVFNLPNDSFSKCSCHCKLHCDSQANFFLFLFFFKSQLKKIPSRDSAMAFHQHTRLSMVKLSCFSFSSPNVLCYTLKGRLPHPLL